ncbi:ATP-dependent helicase [Campylobacter sp. IFREMER_LSEM_CL1846]|uniref:ATP-dependent helicase n=1 Tax=unclassified Campylobacter TaxID=2593542 RepID=UPI0012829866|nr:MULTISPECIES: ATP-dependent helicase [unclassified Campylobacter]EAJ5678660.1 ATP-dependent helicase [Campylobacter lari]EAK0444286.1 ATP-dependent helicase [Campylobacter lari]EAK9942599.1 ATP-dependent helicase [Campylobacter lari]MCV3434104.1 ATP-dependent helicase [Campylobacter sp. IFREMER_LSEM_CL1846]MCV3530892.1 ATP-dependent helicase [Campylobacter sp. CNRCH_2007_0968H]
MPLSRLNEEQYKAASAPFGHNLIIASAGTGKTSTIVARIAFLLQNGIKPEKIMLLTFTNKASKEMIERLGRYFDKSITSKITAGTFHSTAYSLLKELNHDIILKPASELKILLRSIFEKRTFHHLSDTKPYMPSYLYDVYSLFQNTNANLDEFYNWFCQNYDEQAVYAEIYEDILKEYEEEKMRFNYVDFNDLLIKLKHILASHHFEFDEILVDEYQDTNTLQGSLIDAFKSKSLFCVGDYDQSIYAFNGADISIIGSFKDRFVDANIFTLNKNYRSSKNILALANKVILNNERLYPKELIVTREGDFKAPSLLTFNELFDQYSTIAKIILQSGVNLDEIAVIFRNNSSADGVEVALRELGIASKRKGGGSFFESLEVKNFCSMLAIVLNPKDIMAFIHLLEYTKGVGGVLAKDIFDALLKLGNSSLIKGFLNPDSSVNLKKYKKQSYQLGLFDDIEELASPSRFNLESEFNTHPILSLPKINEFCAKNLEKIYLFIKKASECKISTQLVDLILENDYFKEICDILATKRATNKNSNVDLNKKNEILEKINAKMFVLKELAKNYSDNYKYYNFLTLGASEMSSGSGVNLLSIHASKGLEFELVFVIDLAQGRFPNQKLMSMGGSLEEERRLFYVAVTRAKDTLYLSYAKYDKIKKSNYQPSCFLIEAGMCKEE